MSLDMLYRQYVYKENQTLQTVHHHHSPELLTIFHQSKIPEAQIPRKTISGSTLIKAPKQNSNKMCHSRPRCPSCQRRGNCHRRDCASKYPAAVSTMPPTYGTVMIDPQAPSSTFFPGSTRACGHGCGNGCGNRRPYRGPVRALVEYFVW